MDDRRWVQCTPSEYAWERAALAYLKEIVAGRELYRAWANAEFLGGDGSVTRSTSCWLPRPGSPSLRSRMVGRADW